MTFIESLVTFYMTNLPVNYILSIYTGILFSRIWYNFGHPIYSTLQRYLLVDSWLLSRSCIRQFRALILGLLFLFIPLLLLAGCICSIHALGFVNVPVCAPLTNVYYITKRVSLLPALYYSLFLYLL